MKEIYLDNSATTMMLPEAAALMTKIFTEDYGNPSSAHMKGVESERYLREAKETLSKILRCKPTEIFFTSGGTESDNLALIGTARAKRRQGKHLITSSIEHPAVLRTMEYLEKEEGCSVTYLPVNEKGLVSLDDLKSAMRDDTILVSIMHTNNEVGSVQPIEAIGKFLKDKYPSVTFHTDAVQGFGKARIYPHQAGIDLMSISGHKIHGPKGTGIIYIADKTKIDPIIFGGGQQNGMRSGTENVPGAAGIAYAAGFLYDNFDSDREKMYSLKRRLAERLLEIEGVTVNGPAYDDEVNGAPHILSASFPGVRAEVLLHALEDKRIYVSAGSACATHKSTPSDTLTNIGLKQDLLDSTLRFSMSVFTKEEEIDLLAEALKELLPELRRFTRH